MGESEIGRFIYLSLFLLVICGYYFASNRGRMGEMARNAALWFFIIIGMILVVGVWSDVRDTVLPQQSVAIEDGRIEAPRQSDGHYYLTLEISGTPINFVVDTGATEIVLSTQDARRIGLDPDQLDFTGRASTANGQVRTARITLEDVSIGGIEEGDLRAWVNEGELRTSLLGMTYLQRFGKVEISRGKLVLER